MFDETSFSWITVVGTPAPCVVPADAEIFDLRIPASYRLFLSTFGYGLYGGLLLLYPWLPRHPDHVATRAAELRHMLVFSLELGIAELEPDGSPGLLARLVPFGVSENGHTLCWDPASLQAGDEPEVVVVGSKVLSCRRTGRPFHDFLRSVTTKSGARLLGPGYRPLPPQFIADSSQQ
jgi:hypothetical protein